MGRESVTNIIRVLFSIGLSKDKFIHKIDDLRYRGVYREKVMIKTVNRKKRLS